MVGMSTTYAKVKEMCGRLNERANRAITARVGTDRPGSRWITHPDGYPFHPGVNAFARIYPGPAGKAYEVRVATCTGDQHYRVMRATLDAAFRAGERQTAEFDRQTVTVREG